MRSDELSAHLVDSFRKLKAAWPTRGWSWDGRFLCLASSFDSEFASAARNAALIALPHEWGSSNLAKAPTVLQELAAHTGGLRPGQTLFASVPAGQSHAYGLWWPWRDSTSISLRIGLTGPDFTERHNAQLRDVFGVTL
jgi:hypothetical protein